MYGVGAVNSNTVVGGSSLTGSINSNPSFASTSTPDFHLSTSSSPANGAATTTLVPSYDHDGLIRPSPASVGAYEYAAASTVAKPSPPTNLVVNVVTQ